MNNLVIIFLTLLKQHIMHYKELKILEQAVVMRFNINESGLVKNNLN